MKISNKIVMDAVQKVSHKSSRLTGNAIGVAEELLNPLIGHLHEMVFIEPADILHRKMCQDESDDDGDDKGPSVIDISKKKNKMPSKIQRGRSGDKGSKDDDNHN